MEWKPTKFFESVPRSKPYALLVLNQPINPNAYKILKQHASFTICADGGANRFYELMRKNGTESTELPNAIVGDLDSIRPFVRKHYENLGVPVLEDPDQYSTDFTKCLRHLKSNIRTIVSSNISPGPPQSTAESEVQDDGTEPHLDVLVLGGLGGRVDQAFSQIHHLYTASQSSLSAADRPAGDLYLISEESITFLLPEGKSTIFTPGGNSLEAESRWKAPTSIPGSHSALNGDKPISECPEKCYLSENVGIIPVGGPSVINTEGLEWDVHDWKTEFGGQFSTSNHIRADMVEIRTTAPVLFTVELADWLKFHGRV
ncbi:hypothetical protein DIZ76_015713 [Coccidioides immitis]|uniref:Thiamine pyrophosphokinase n=1 Tax=Coccidioides immitis RMSCC 3703 TaxID=454286 RepID=A0A0J8RAS5_COCIT|nr:hypothetical protein CISG_08837 [Coccidioides immitis RMSCC 3703]TPX21751.1 hypothetical protein DIZ76_015713 [Coccidioides immitis]